MIRHFTRQIPSIGPAVHSCTFSTMTDHINRLRKPWVHIKDEEKVERTIEGLIAGGPDKLQLIVDFDYTLTRAHKNGTPVDCSWGVMENSSLLSKEYISETNEIKKKYLPIELDPKMTVEEKIPYMIEWYTKANKLLQKCGVSQAMFHEMVSASNVDFRDGVGILLDELSKVNVPVLILSAGLGDLLIEILKHRKVYHDNIKVVSNFLKFDDEGKVTGLQGDMIHMFNKNENAVHDSPYFKELMHRHNVILMGDSLGDLRMAEGVENLENILKIGFLNSHIEEKLDTYKNQYDVVLTDDQTMNFANGIIEQIMQEKKC